MFTIEEHNMYVLRLSSVCMCVCVCVCVCVLIMTGVSPCQEDLSSVIILQPTTALLLFLSPTDATAAIGTGKPSSRGNKRAPSSYCTHTHTHARTHARTQTHSTGTGRVVFKADDQSEIVCFIQKQGG